MDDLNKLQEEQREFENCVAFNTSGFKDSKANYTSLLMQYLFMAVILIVERKFHSREKTYIIYRSNTDF